MVVEAYTTWDHSQMTKQAKIQLITAPMTSVISMGVDSTYPKASSTDVTISIRLLQHSYSHFLFLIHGLALTHHIHQPLNEPYYNVNNVRNSPYSRRKGRRATLQTDILSNSEEAAEE